MKVETVSWPIGLNKVLRRAKPRTIEGMFGSTR